MYNSQSYDEYIRSILGYPLEYQPQSNIYYEEQNTSLYRKQDNSELEDLYPEIYKIIYPMVKKACSKNMEITRDNIEDIVDEIYFAVESDNIINVNINLQNDVEGVQNRSNQTTKPSIIQHNNRERKKQLNNKEIQENRRESRKFINRNLRDLIKILILRELLQNQKSLRPPIPPNRPSIGRTTFFGEPIINRVPIRPRMESIPYDIYEY